MEVLHLGPDHQIDRAAADGEPGRAGRHVFAARWYDPEIRQGLEHRFVLKENNARPEIRSEPFD
jgi:hypothetical protein